jgi:hypothetical protein
LDGPFEPGEAEFVQQQGQDYGSGETQEDFKAADDEGVTDDFPEFEGRDEGAEMF